MRVELTSADGSKIEITACKTFGLVLKAKEKELVTISLNGEVAVNGNHDVEPELIGLAVLQWANQYKQVMGGE